MPKRPHLIQHQHYLLWRKLLIQLKPLQLSTQPNVNHLTFTSASSSWLSTLSGSLFHASFPSVANPSNDDENRVDEDPDNWVVYLQSSVYKYWKTKAMPPYEELDDYYGIDEREINLETCASLCPLLKR